MRKTLIIFLLLTMVFGIATIQVQAEESVNLSGYAFATGNNYESENKVPMYAVDGVIDAESRWRPTTTVEWNEETQLYQHSRQRGAWLALEFEFDVTITSAKIYWHTECAAPGYFSLQYSPDGKDWEDVPDATYGTRTGNGNWETPYLDEITFPAITAKFFRVYSTAGETEAGLGSIYEFELYGDDAPYAFLKGNQEDNNENSAVQNPSELPKDNGNGTLIVIVIAVGVLCLVAIAIFTLIQLKKPGKGGKDA